MIELKQYAGSLITPTDDALLYNFWLSGQSGFFEGCEVTSLGGNQLRVSSGRGVILGRVFVIEEEIILANLSGGGTINGRLIVRVDTQNTTAPIQFVTQATTTLPALIQEDINRSGSVYELQLATYQVNEIAISGLSVTRTLVTDPMPQKASASELKTAQQNITAAQTAITSLQNNKADETALTQTDTKLTNLTNNFNDHANNADIHINSHSKAFFCYSEKNGNVHTLKNIDYIHPNSNMLVVYFLAAGDYVYGDKIYITGLDKTFTPYTPQGNQLPGGAFKAWSMVMFVTEVGSGKVFFRLGGGMVPPYTYTGSHTMFESFHPITHAPRYYAELYTSGVFTLQGDGVVDVWMIGGGGAGGNGSNTTGNSPSGGGGGSGYTSTARNVALAATVQYPVTIGGGGQGQIYSHDRASNGGLSTFGSFQAAGGQGGNRTDGGDGGSGGGSGGDGMRGGSDGGNGLQSWGAAGLGQGTTTRPFDGDVAPFSAMQKGGGGGGGGRAYGNSENYYPREGGPGGDGGGGHGGGSDGSAYPIYMPTDGQTNTGSGGGGGLSQLYENYASPLLFGASGADGLVIVRVGDWSA